MKPLINKVIVPSAAADLVSSDRFDQLVVAMDGLTFPTFLLSKTQYKLDVSRLLNTVQEYFDNKKVVDLTVGDLQEMDFFEKLPRDSLDQSMIPSVSALIDFSDNRLEFPYPNSLGGATVVIGAVGSGKSFYVLKTKGVDVLIRLNEPMENLDNDDSAYPATSVTNALSVSIVLSLLGLKVAIDSFKSLVFGLEGAALTGGMSSGVFDFMTTANNVIANFGVNVLITVNPMDPLKVQPVYDMLSASVTGAVLIENKRVFAETYRLADGRVSESGGFKDDLNAADSYELEGPREQINISEDLTSPTREVVLSRVDQVDDFEPPRTGGKLVL